MRTALARTIRCATIASPASAHPPPNVARGVPIPDPDDALD